MYEPDNIEIEIQWSPNERFKTFAALPLTQSNCILCFLDSSYKTEEIQAKPVISAV